MPENEHIDIDFSERQPYFSRVEDGAFWADKERIKVLIDLYEYYECLWKAQSSQYKHITKKKAAKVDIGKHLGWSGKWFYLLVSLLWVVF